MSSPSMLKKKMLTDRSGDLHDRILEQKAQEMANDIDREILWSMLESLGWQRVVLVWPVTMNNLQDIHTWIDENISGAYEKNRGDFIFEDDKDAMWFKLRWLG